MKTQIHDAQQTVSRQRGMAVALIWDSDPEVARVMVTTLARRSIRAHIVVDRKAALDTVDRGRCDMVFVALTQVQTAGVGICVDVIQQLKVNNPERPVILLTGPDEVQGHLTLSEQGWLWAGTEVVKQAIGAGCTDVLVKPLAAEHLDNMLDRFLPNRKVCHITQTRDPNSHSFRIVGRSVPMRHTVALAERIAPTSAPVLITGESGTGKELISYLIHQHSQRAGGPYVRVNCAALSDSLLESELFGHEKGAFTGAVNQRKGRFERAHGGTLLLDEITETPPAFQAKLLRILEQQEFERVGGHRNIQVNVRVISTTNKDVTELMQQGRFRHDLYYRLCATRLVLPPLRRRKDDLVELVWHFVNEYARESQRQISTLDPVMMSMFANYEWPGNIRQLRNVVRSSLILGQGPVLSLADTSWLFEGIEAQMSDGLVSTASLQDEDDMEEDSITDLGGLSLEVIERRAILDTLRQTDGNRKRAAEVLGISDRTLRERIRRYKQDDCLLTI